VKPGDRVLLPGWGGNAIKLGDDVSPARLAVEKGERCADDLVQEYFLFKDSEILAKINE
jgi:chaperonin GroES